MERKNSNIPCTLQHALLLCRKTRFRYLHDLKTTRCYHRASILRLCAVDQKERASQSMYIMSLTYKQTRETRARTPKRRAQHNLTRHTSYTYTHIRISELPIHYIHTDTLRDRSPDSDL